MTWKDLQKLIQSSNLSKGLDRLQGLPFWIWSKEEHILKHSQNKGHCCFNHAIGLPTKNGKEKPLFDYQKTILDSLQQYRHIFILKATGLGISELFLRYMSYLALNDNKYQNSQMVIVTGPNLDLATKLIKRMKNLFSPLLYFDSKETVLELNRCRIEAYPSNHIDSFRSLDNPKFILLDECDFFRQSEADEVRALAERYIGKSNPYIVLVSTPNRPNGLMQKIEQEQNSLYHKIKLDYRYGLGKIYTDEDITKAKQSPSFDREYDLQYLGKIGNLYSQFSINQAIERKYNVDQINPYTEKYMSIDEGFSSSKFAVVVVQVIRKETTQVQILHADELDKPLYEEALDHILQLRKKYGNVQNIAFDASRPELGLSLKKKIDERYDFTYVQDKLKYCKKYGLDPAQYMIVVPIVFNTETRNYMTSHSRRLLDDPKGRIAINPKFTKLITALKSAQFDDVGKLDKEQSPHNDILDAFQMVCTFFKYKNK